MRLPQRVLVVALLLAAACGSDESPTLHQDDAGSCADPAVECPTTDVTDP